MLLSCKSENKDNDTFIIKKIEINESADEIPKIYPLFYGQHNFILFNHSKIYYHNKNSFQFCGTGLDDSKPPFLELHTKDLTEISLKKLSQFLNQKIKKDHNNTDKTIISISSPKDTISNKALRIIKEKFKNNKTIGITIRKCTEEESVVSKAKYNKRKYDCEKQKWEIGFN
jgi:hypothetical protein